MWSLDIDTNIYDTERDQVWHFDVSHIILSYIMIRHIINLYRRIVNLHVYRAVA